MADSEDVLYEVADGVATITLNRPETLNALTPPMGRRYAELLHAADDDPAVRAVVVTGAGRGFCSGADLGVLAQGADALDGFLADQRLEDLPTTALSLGVPVIGAVNGPCAGIGFVLALCTDVRFAGPGARMSSSFARLGLTAEYGIGWLLPRIVGLPRATEILLSGRTVDAEEALRIGMVHDLVDDPLAAAQDYARTLVDTCSPRAMATIKGQLRRAGDQDLEATVVESLDLMRQSFRWPDLAEALVSRLEKRPVRFPDR